MASLWLVPERFDRVNVRPPFAAFPSTWSRMVSNNIQLLLMLHCNAQLNPFFFSPNWCCSVFFFSLHAGHREQITVEPQCRVRLLKTSLTQLTCTVTLTNWMSATMKSRRWMQRQQLIFACVQLNKRIDLMPAKCFRNCWVITRRSASSYSQVSSIHRHSGIIIIAPCCHTL